MIFIATNADASANNLGKISIKTIADVSQDTYNLITAYGNKELTDDQILALDDFLISFNNATWKSKVKRLVIPILGNDNENPSISKGGTEYGNLYDIVTNETGKLSSGTNKNGDNHGAVITFNNGIYFNSFSDSANYVPFFKYTEIPYDVRDLMFGVYGKRGNDENNNSNSVVLMTKEPQYASYATLKEFKAGAVTLISIIPTAETEKGADFNLIFSYIYESSFFKGYKDGVLVSASTVKDTYASGDNNNGFGVSPGDTSSNRIGNTIKIMTLGSSMSEEEMAEYDTLLRTLLAVFVE